MANTSCTSCGQALDKRPDDGCGNVNHRRAYTTELELRIHELTVSEQEASRRADYADVIVTPVKDGLPGEIDVLSDGHSHHYVPTSSVCTKECHLAFHMTGGAHRLDCPAYSDVSVPVPTMLQRLRSIESAAQTFITALEEEMPDGLECAKEWAALQANIAVTIRSLKGDS